MQHPTPPRRLPLQVRFPDPLKHFSRDGPFIRLTALIVCTLPRLVSSILLTALVAFETGRRLQWW